MITSLLFDGDLGAGKTLSAVALAVSLASGSGVPLLSNMTIQGAEKIETVEDWAKISSYRHTGSVVLLDEAQSVLDSRTSQTKGQVRFTEFLMYLRKMRCVVIFTTPSYNMVDLRVRERLNFRIHVSRVRGRVIWDIYDAYTDEFQKSRVFKQERFQSYYGLYDTYEIIAPIELPTDLRVLIGA